MHISPALIINEKLGAAKTDALPLSFSPLLSMTTRVVKAGGASPHSQFLVRRLIQKIPEPSYNSQFSRYSKNHLLLLLEK